MTRAPDESLIRFLQWMLRRAEAGEIDGIAVVTTQPSADDAKLGDTCWNGDGVQGKTAEVIGNLEILKARLIEVQRHEFRSEIMTHSPIAAE